MSTVAATVNNRRQTATTKPRNRREEILLARRRISGEVSRLADDTGNVSLCARVSQRGAPITNHAAGFTSIPQKRIDFLFEAVSHLAAARRFNDKARPLAGNLAPPWDCRANEDALAGTIISGLLSRASNKTEEIKAKVRRKKGGRGRTGVGGWRMIERGIIFRAVVH